MRFDQLQRREFITLLGGAAAAWPIAARGQDRRATIGYLDSSTPLAENQRVAALLQRLRELGWVEGRNLAIEYRWAEARTERCTAGLTRPTNLEAAPSYGRNGVWCSLSCELRMEHSP